MISRPDAQNSIIKLDLCAPFCTRFLMLPALRAPQIVKLELGGQKIAFMAVPAVRGPQIVKLELGGQNIAFMAVPAVRGPQTVKLELVPQQVEVGSRPFKGVHPVSA